MVDVISKFKTDYKKCRVFGMDEVKYAKTLSDRVKYFRFDMKNGLEYLEEVVLEEKCSPEPIKATKIEDYAKVNKTIRDVLKDVDFNQGKVADACRELNELPSINDIKTALKKLEGLKAEIDDDLKTRDKKCKSRPAIEKLEKQIEADLKAGEEFIRKINKIPKDYFVADKDYDSAIKAILNAKPRLSAKTQKFNKLLTDVLTKVELGKTVKSHEGLETALKNEAETAVNAAKESKTREIIKHWQTGAKTLKDLQKKTKIYADIKKKYKSEIDKSDDKKLIENSIKRIEQILTDAEEGWEKAEAEITELSKK